MHFTLDCGAASALNTAQIGTPLRFFRVRPPPPIAVGKHPSLNKILNGQNQVSPARPQPPVATGPMYVKTSWYGSNHNGVADRLHEDQKTDVAERPSRPARAPLVPSHSRPSAEKPAGLRASRHHHHARWGPRSPPTGATATMPAPAPTSETAPPHVALPATPKRPPPRHPRVPSPWPKHRRSSPSPPPPHQCIRNPTGLQLARSFQTLRNTPRAPARRTSTFSLIFQFHDHTQAASQQRHGDHISSRRPPSTREGRLRPETRKAKAPLADQNGARRGPAKRRPGSQPCGRNPSWPSTARTS
jgi:hypothetical protein